MLNLKIHEASLLIDTSDGSNPDIYVQIRLSGRKQRTAKQQCNYEGQVTWHD